MPDNEKYQQELQKGLKLAEYRWLKEMAMKNEMVTQGDGRGGMKEVPARALFVEIYHEPVPEF